MGLSLGEFEFFASELSGYQAGRASDHSYLLAIDELYYTALCAAG